MNPIRAAVAATETLPRLAKPRVVPVRGVTAVTDSKNITHRTKITSHSHGRYDFRPRPTGDPDPGPIPLGDGSSGPSGAAIKFLAGADPRGSWTAGYGSAAVVGGMFGMMADPDHKVAGFAKGAAGGMIGGKAFRTFSRKGAGASSSLFNGLDSRLAGGQMGPLSRGWSANKHVVHKGLKGFHSTEGRHNMFRSGAMLGGGAFGVMFASNGRSHKRGFNSNRGNSFSR